MIPKPSLDDRTFDDIVDEAIRLIPQYCPEWNNYNPADPGIALIELFAWMTEMMLYRLNRVPERNLLTFLELMGIEPTPPRPAQTVLTFSLNDKGDSVTVPQHTRVETRPTAEDRPVLFETDRSILATNNSIVGAFSQFHDEFSDHTGFLGKKNRSFQPFLQARTIERFIYLADERFEYLEAPSLLTLEFELPGGVDLDLSRSVTWSFWDGERWQDMSEAPIETGPNMMAFEGPLEIQSTEVDEIEAFWIRAQLADVPDETVVVETVRARVEVRGEGILPDNLYSNPESTLFVTLDPERTFAPLGKEPSADSAFYIAADSLFSKDKMTFKLEVELVEALVSPTPTSSDNLVLQWEFNDGKRWRALGKSGPGVDKTIDTYGFQDGTNGLVNSGIIRFRRPKPMKALNVNGIEANWVRCRIEQGDYGVPGTYELDGDRWVWRDEKPLTPPIFKGFSLKFQEEDQVVNHLLSYNDFQFVNHTNAAEDESKNFKPFDIVPEECPTFYLGFEEVFPHGTNQIYFKVKEQERGGARGFLGDGMIDPTGELLREQTLVWEYWSGRKWLDLPIEDESRNLTQSGFIRFISPKTHRANKRFGHQAFWFRVRLEMGGYHVPPVLEDVLLNTVTASNVTTFEESILGNSDGIPNQSFLFPRGPVLDGEAIDIIEVERPNPQITQQIIDESGPNAVREFEDGGWRIRWKRVDSFFESRGESRHYVKDIITNRITFGDGQRGKIPPKGARAVRAARYQVGGGESGNVAANSLVVLRKPIAYVEGVTNRYPAQGGSDLESIEDVKRRGPFVLKSRSRAVTAEDFEWLAREASPSVSRVKCLPSLMREGEVNVIVVPHVPKGHADFMKKPIPSLALLRHVKRHLTSHKLVTTILHVLKPTFVEFDVEVEIFRRASGPSERLKRQTDEAIRLFCHPLVGGRDRQGWPFGRSVYKVDLFHVVEEIPEVDLVHRINLFDVRKGRPVDFIELADDALVFVRNIEVTERSREQIV